MIIVVLILVILDQVSKFLSVKYLADSPLVISNFFKLDYVENHGAAFGIMQGKQTFFIVLTCLVLVILSLYIYKNINELSVLEKIALEFFLAGAAGNLIDRAFRGYVVDFISLRFFDTYNFPVFNLADIYINIGVILFLYITLFQKKTL